MSVPLVLIGGGEHARVVVEAARSRPGAFDLLGFVDPQPCEETSRRLAVPRLGDEDALSKYPAAQCVIAVGPTPGNDLRARIAARLATRVAAWARIVHERAWVSPTATLGEGAVIMAGAVVQTGAVIGAHAVVNSGAVVEHDVALGAFVHVAPGAVIGGGSSVGQDSMIGLGARVRDHVRVGPGALVAMGAVVIGDVPASGFVKGVPAR